MEHLSAVATCAYVAGALARGCRLHIAMHQNWDPMVFEQSIDALDLPLVTTYIGDSVTLLREYLAVAKANHDAVIFYHWRPSMLLAGSGFVEVGLSDDPAVCGTEETDWGYEMCQVQSSNIVRVMNPSLNRRLPDAWTRKIVILSRFACCPSR